MTNDVQVRYSPGRFRDCQWCHGRGCAACDGEADKAYKLAFPDGPKPMATFRCDSQEDMAVLQAVFSADAIRRAFGPDGKGMEEIRANLRKHGRTPEDEKGGGE